jgi:transposase
MNAMDIIELIRLLRTGASDHRISKLLRYNRRTIARYRSWAQRQGLLEGELPAADRIHHLLAETLPMVLPPQQISSVAQYAEEIADYRARGMEVAAIKTRLEERHQQPISYSAVWRLVQKEDPPRPEVFVRVEVPPGSEAQVDFGYAGLTLDPATGRARKSWVFVLVLSWSRHLYAEIVFDQRVETWLLCHAHAFAAFGGVPARIVPDNLKAAIVRASFTEPVVQRAYRECAEHYGFLIDPNPPRSPHLKGKVEQGGVHYVKRNFLAGRELEPLDERNSKLRTWTEQVAGGRVHGTTKQRPLPQFRTVEQATLGVLPAVPYDLAIWKAAALHRDCYVTFEQAYYSAPYRLVGQQLWVRGGSRTVELYTAAHELVATHDRATAPGERKTNLAHLPPEKVPGLALSRATCQEQAQAIGPHTTRVVERLLTHRPEDRLRVAQRLLQLAARYGTARLERACARAEAFGEGDYVSVKRILEAGLEQQPGPEPARVVPTADDSGSPPEAGWSYVFVRQAGEFVASLLGAAR